MISFVMAARNAPEWTTYALRSIELSIKDLAWQQNAEVLLLDDASDPQLGITQLFRQFSASSKVPTKIIRFHVNQHYSRMVSAALSFATGENIFFLSNDMIFTPHFFKTLLDVSNLDPSIGIVRGTSNYTDSHPEHIVTPPTPMRTIDEVRSFSKAASEQWQLAYSIDDLLSADAVLFKRKLIDAIGVVDNRYFGYFGDVDYGLRAIRAGFRLVCARGAWLYHDGAGYMKDEIVRQKLDAKARHDQRMEIVQRAYEQFRLKWDPTLPEKAGDLPSLDLPQLKAMQPMELHRYFPPIQLTPQLGEIMN